MVSRQCVCFVIREKLLSIQGADKRLPWIPPKLWYPPRLIHRFMTQQTAVWMLTAMEIWKFIFILSVNTVFPHNIFQNSGPLELHYYVQRFYSIGTCFIQLMNFWLIYKPLKLIVLYIKYHHVWLKLHRLDKCAKWI